MRIFCVVMVFFCCLTLCAYAEQTPANTQTLDELLESHAKEQAIHLNELLDSQTYLDYWVGSYQQCEAADWAAIRNTDYSDPRKVNIVIRPADDLDLASGLNLPEEELQYWIEHAPQEICMMPLILLKDYSDLPLRMTKDALVVQSAVTLKELDGIAYVVQLYDDFDGSQAPMLITAFIPYEGSDVLVHTEIVYGNQGDVKTLHSIFFGLLNMYTGTFESSEVIVRTYRETTDNP